MIAIKEENYAAKIYLFPGHCFIEFLPVTGNR